MATKKAKEKIDYTPDELMECRERASIYNCRFEESVPTEWVMYADLGWVHADELVRFGQEHGQCVFTKKWFHKSDLMPTFGHRLISKAAIMDGGYSLCFHSKLYCKSDSLVEVWIGQDARMVHESFIRDAEYFKCDISNKFYHRTERIVVQKSIGLKLVSKTQANRLGSPVKRCEGCGVWLESHEVTTRIWDRGVTTACNTCNVKQMARGLIHPHNYDVYPAPIHQKYEYWRMTGESDRRRRKKIESDGIRLFGIELEVELNKDGCASKGLDRFSMALEIKDMVGADFVIFKEDGSLAMNGHYRESSYAGFEIVSAPADIDVHRQRWTKLSDIENFKQLRAWDTDTCGMHVHVSKDALTTLQIGRILMFMTHGDNKNFIAKVAGRNENRYCKSFHKERLAGDIKYGESKVIDGVEYIQASFSLPRNDESRRQAVNITNDKTIEFRVFRGTVNPRHIIRNIEFVDAVCSYCHPGSRSFQELKNWRPFISYCKENRKTYPLFVEWCESDMIGLLPKRNAYGEKDTRGSQKPEIIEALHDSTMTNNSVKYRLNQLLNPIARAAHHNDDEYDHEPDPNPAPW